MKYFFYLLVLGFSFSCNNSLNSEKTEDQLENGKNKYATGFKIIKHQEFTEIQIISPNEANKGQIEKRYALAKDLSALKLSKEFIPIAVPIKSIIALGGTDIGFLEKINCSGKISGILNLQYIYNKKVRENAVSKKVKEIGDLAMINPESLLGVSKIISYSGFGTPPPNEEKLEKLGILCIPSYDWKENHPLGKAEWIKVFGALFDKELEADSYYINMVKEYNEILKSIDKSTKKPSLISGSMIGDLWYMPAGESFNADLFYKSQANYLNKNSKGTGSSALTFEHVFKNFQHADFWINPSFKSKKELLQANSKYAYFDAFKKDKIYCYSHNMNHFWEMSAIEPQKVLSDLINIFHSEKSKNKLYFYKKIN